MTYILGILKDPIKTDKIKYRLAPLLTETEISHIGILTDQSIHFGLPTTSFSNRDHEPIIIIIQSLVRYILWLCFQLHH
jgi:hypothetical protein